MPLYEYHCDSCGNDFEAFRVFADRQNIPCRKCNELAQKKFSVVNATFTWVMDGITHDNPRRWHDPYVP